MTKMVTRYRRVIGQLNELAGRARNDDCRASLDEKATSNPVFMELLELLENAGILVQNGFEVRFTSESNRFFANGGWFESHVYSTVFNLRRDLAGIQDAGHNVEVSRGQGAQTVDNEIDVAFLAHNRLHIIECKTRGWNHEPGHDTDALYKLDSLHDRLGGLKAKAMLVSYRKITSRAAQRRARELDIRLVHGAQVARLREHIENWVQPAANP